MLCRDECPLSLARRSSPWTTSVKIWHLLLVGILVALWAVCFAFLQRRQQQSVTVRWASCTQCFHCPSGQKKQTKEHVLLLLCMPPFAENKESFKAGNAQRKLAGDSRFAAITRLKFSYVICLLATCRPQRSWRLARQETASCMWERSHCPFCSPPPGGVSTYFAFVFWRLPTCIDESHGRPVKTLRSEVQKVFCLDGECNRLPRPAIWLNRRAGERDHSGSRLLRALR